MWIVYTTTFRSSGFSRDTKIRIKVEITIGVDKF